MIKIYSILSEKQKLAFFFLFIFGLIAMVLELLGLTLVIPIIYTLLDDNFFLNYPKFMFINEFNDPKNPMSRRNFLNQFANFTDYPT